MHVTKKRLIAALITIASISLPAIAQKDIVILKNGKEFNASIIQVNDRQVVYKLSSKKNDPELSVDNSDVYMLHFSKRGNVYINESGKRITGENQTLPKDADIIYLVKGREIPAFDLKVYDDRISYLSSKPNKKSVPVAEILPRNEVFMIKYVDGTTDLINDLSIKTDKSTELSATQMEPATESSEKVNDEMLVVFHNVKKGDTLLSIAQRYDVTVNDIILWNELPAKMKSNAKLQIGMQIMLYVKPTEAEPSKP